MGGSGPRQPGLWIPEAAAHALNLQDLGLAVTLAQLWENTAVLSTCGRSGTLAYKLVLCFVLF